MRYVPPRKSSIFRSRLHSGCSREARRIAANIGKPPRLLGRTGDEAK